MPIIRARGWVAAPIDEVFAFFDDPSNLPRLMPPPARIRVVGVEPMPPQIGSTIEFRYGVGPVQRSWVIRLTDRVPQRRIADETLSGPLARFHHAHTFTPARHGTWIEDRIDYHVGPDGLIGSVADRVAGWVLRLTFVWRHARQRRILR